MQFLFMTMMTTILASYAFNLNKVKPETKFKYVGDTAPLGYFDPLNFIDNKSEEFLKYLREIELQHSRVAMLSMVALPLIDLNSPDNYLAINYVSEHNLPFQLALLLAFGYLESERVIRNYQNPLENGLPFTIQDEKEPGQYLDVELDERLMNVELNNGRLAMIASIGYIAQELVTQQPIF